MKFEECRGVHHKVEDLNEYEQRAGRSARNRNRRGRPGRHNGGGSSRRLEVSAQSFQIESKIAGRYIALVNALAQAFLQDAPEFKRSRRIVLLQRRRFFLEDVGDG